MVGTLKYFVWILLLGHITGKVMVQQRDVGFFYETLGKALFVEGRVELVIETNLKEFEDQWEEFNITIKDIKESCDRLMLSGCADIYMELKEEVELLWLEWQIVNGVRREKKDVVNYLLHFVGLERYDPLLTFNMESILENEKSVGEVIEQTNSEMKTLVSQLDGKFNKVAEGVKGVQSLINKINKAGFDVTQDMKVGFHMDLIILELKDQFRILRQQLELMTDRSEEKISLGKLGLMLRNVTILDKFVGSLGKYRDYSLETMTKTVEVEENFLRTIIRVKRFGEKEADLIKITPIPEVKGGIIRLPHTKVNFVTIEIGTRQINQLEGKSNPCEKIRDGFNCPMVMQEKLSNNSDCAIRNIFDTVSCEFWDLGGTNVLYKRVSDNKFIFARVMTSVVKVECNGKKSEIQLKGTGIISLQEGCTLHDGTIYLRANEVARIPILVHLKQIESTKESSNLSQNNKRELLVEEDGAMKDFIIKPLQISKKELKLRIKEIMLEYKSHGVSVATLLCLFVFYKCGGIKLISFLFSKFRKSKSSWKLEDKSKEKEDAQLDAVRIETNGSKDVNQKLKHVMKKKPTLNESGEVKGKNEIQQIDENVKDESAQ